MVLTPPTSGVKCEDLTAGERAHPKGPFYFYAKSRTESSRETKSTVVFPRGCWDGVTAHGSELLWGGGENVPELTMVTSA